MNDPIHELVSSPLSADGAAHKTTNKQTSKQTRTREEKRQLEMMIRNKRKKRKGAKENDEAAKGSAHVFLRPSLAIS